MNWIDCRVSMPEINETVLIYRKDRKEYLVGVYLGNSQFHYADCCQGIQKTCTASHWMPLPESPINNRPVNEKAKWRKPNCTMLAGIKRAGHFLPNILYV